MVGVNQYRGEVAVTLGARTILLRPTFDAICRMESAAGCGVIALAQKICDGSIAAVQIAAMIETCQVSEPALTQAAIGEALLQDGITQCLPVLARMLELVLGGDETMIR